MPCSSYLSSLFSIFYLFDGNGDHDTVRGNLGNRRRHYLIQFCRCGGGNKGINALCNELDNDLVKKIPVLFSPSSNLRALIYHGTRKDELGSYCLSCSGKLKFHSTIFSRGIFPLTAELTHRFLVKAISRRGKTNNALRLKFVERYYAREEYSCAVCNV